MFIVLALDQGLKECQVLFLELELDLVLVLELVLVLVLELELDLPQEQHQGWDLDLVLTPALDLHYHSINPSTPVIHYDSNKPLLAPDPSNKLPR